MFITKVVLLFGGPLLCSAFFNINDCKQLYGQLKSGPVDVSGAAFEKLLGLINSNGNDDEQFTRVIQSVHTQNMGGEINQLDWRRLYSECTVLNPATNTRMTIPVVLFSRGLDSAIIASSDRYLFTRDNLYHANGDHGNNVLHYAVMMKNERLVDFLVKFFQQRFAPLLKAPNSNGVTPFNLACTEWRGILPKLQTHYRMQAGGHDPLRQVPKLECDGTAAPVNAQPSYQPAPVYQPPTIAAPIVSHNTVASQYNVTSQQQPVMAAGVASAQHFSQPMAMQPAGMVMRPQVAFNPMMSVPMMGNPNVPMMGNPPMMRGSVSSFMPQQHAGQQALGSMLAPQVPSSFMTTNLNNR